MSSDDFEWDATAAPPPTTWSTTATATRPARGRRGVYGSRANRGPSKLYGRNRAGTSSSSNANNKSVLVREESIGPLDEHDELGGFAAGTENSTSGHQRHPSDENIRNGRSGSSSGGGLMQREASMNSTLDSSISSAGTAAAAAASGATAFDTGAPGSAAANASGTTMRFPPRPNGGIGIGIGIGGHNRSNSASGLPGRPPASATSSVSSSASSFHHQRSTSFMSPLGGGIVGSGSVLFGNNAANGRSTSLTALEGIDRENYHPNHPPTSSASSSLNNTPQKVFGTSLSAPNSAAPSPAQPGFDDEVSSISSRNNPNRRTKKTRTASDGDTAAIAAAFSSSGGGGRGGAAGAGPTPRPMSVPISSPMSSTSVTSSTSFSSLSRMGDMAPTWVKRSLQDGIGRASSVSSSAATAAHARRPSLDLNPSNSASLGPSPGLSSSSSAYAYNTNTNLSSPTRSIAAGSTASSRKRGVCDSPVLDGDDIVYSPGGSAGMMSCSSRRSRARSRIFSPDSTKKLMARAARGTGCGIVDDDFLRSVGTDGSNHSHHGRHSSLSLSQQSFVEEADTKNPFAASLSSAASTANDDSSHHHHHHHHHHRRGGLRKRNDGSLHPEDSDDDTDEDDDDDHSNSSMVDASMETEGSEPAGIVMSSRLHAHRKNDNDDDPTARLFGASGDGDGGNALPADPPVLSQMSPPPRANRRSRSDTFAESIFGSVDGDGGDSFAMATSPERRGGGACNLDDSPVASPDDKTNAGDDADTVVGADEQHEKEEDPLEDVSSYEDLKYLIKILRKWSNSKNAASFGAGTGCTIAIPAKWSQARRQSFLTWSIQGLGFNIDSVQQGKARSIKAPARKATKIHQDLEAKLVRHKELTGHSTGAPGRAGAPSKSIAAAETEIESHPLFASASQMAARSKRSSSTNGVPRSVAFPQRSKDVDVDLLCNMDSLALDESASSARPSKVAHRAAAAAAPEGRKNNDHGTPLVRVVTLDPRQGDVSSSLPCFAPMSVESKGAATPSFELARPRAPRHSGEYDSEDCGGSTDIMQHIHGYSPEEDEDDMGGNEREGRGGRGGMGRRFGARPPRMSTGSTSTRPRSLGGRNLMPPLEETTPAPPSQIKMMSLVKATPTFDIATPMPDGPGFWGSRPIPGKDWGTSEKCDAAILAVLLERLDKAFAESEYCDPNSPVPMITSQTPFTESTAKKNVAPPIPFMNQPISETAASSAALGFDLEVEKKRSPVQLLRPKSRLNLDGAESDTDEEDDDEALEINGGDDFDADMGMGSILNRRETTFEDSRRRTTITAGRASRGVYGSSGGGNNRGLVRHGSVGATALSALVLNELGPSPDKLEKRRKMSLAVRKRMSLCAVAFDVKQSRRYTSSFAVAPSPTKFGKGRSNRRQTAFMAGGANAIAETSSMAEDDSLAEDSAMDAVLCDEELLSPIFSYLTEEELLVSASAVQTSWAEAATSAHATLMLVSVGCSTSFVEGGNDEDDDSDDEGDDATTDGSSSMMQMVENTGGNSNSNDSIAKSMVRSWHFLNDKFPWATFLSEGAFKRVYRVWNSTVNAEEAVSVMDVDAIEDMGNKEIVGAELSVSVLLSSLVRRNVCPNFVVTRGVFTCPYEPASSHWGCAENKKPMGSIYDPNRALSEGLPATPSEEEKGKFQYIRMELCRHGDMEEWLKTQPGQGIAANEARILFFQMAFALHAAADRYSMKHYDVKLLNFFLQSANDDSIGDGTGNAMNGSRRPYTVLRYGIGSSVFGLRMPTSRALIAKLADYGTANIRPESNGQPVTIGQFTTLENSPPEFLISGDAAKQGYGHDSFGLGLCMLHLFTGHAPYEEILEDVKCPVALKRKLKNIWENQSSNGYDVLRSVILADVYEDEDGNVEGEPDEVLYDTLYRYLVLFGIPDKKTQFKEGARVWRAITSCLIGQVPKSTASASVPARRSTRRNAARSTAAVMPATSAGPDASQFEIDTSLYSLRTGTDPRIAEARQKLEAMDGGMELLLSLVSFDPSTRATPLDAINSTFFSPLREEDGMVMYGPSDEIKSFMAMGYAT